MADQPAFARKGLRPLADVVGEALTPACRKRGFSTIDLVSFWPDIVGAALAGNTSPERLSWPRQPSGLITEESHEPALLTLRCNGAAALRLNHEAPQLIERINAFFGYRCVGRIRIIQLPVARLEPRRRKALPAISPAAEARVKSLASGIEDADLRQKIERLGRAVSANAARPITKS